MANDDTPEMPAAASSNMAMRMSTVSATSKKLSGLTINSATPTQDTPKESEVQPQSGHSKDVPVTTSAANARRDKPSNRERALNIQRIELAEKLGNERKQRTDLEARIASLQEEIAGLTSNNEALEADLARLRAEYDSTVQQLDSITTEAKKVDEESRERVRELESRLGEASKNLEQSILNFSKLQNNFDEIVEKFDQQTDLTMDLKKELEISRTRLHDSDVTILQLGESSETREADLKERLAEKDRELAEASKEIEVLHLENADVIIESHKLRESVKKLQNSTAPFDQTIVIGVDLSGSTSSVEKQIKNAYRDVLHMIKSNNSDAKVAVVIHGSPEGENPSPSPVEVISEKTFEILDSLDGLGGTEDYNYCLEKATDVFRSYANDKRLLILIGDGNAENSDPTSLSDTCEELSREGIMAHSIALPNGSRFSFRSGWTTEREGWTMEKISQITGGRVEYQYTYLSALNDLLREEREQHFRYLDDVD